MVERLDTTGIAMALIMMYRLLVWLESPGFVGCAMIWAVNYQHEFGNSKTKR
jgi:hypothetical protein